jgi:hypothetical protein
MVLIIWQMIDIIDCMCTTEYHDVTSPISAFLIYGYNKIDRLQEMKVIKSFGIL